MKHLGAVFGFLGLAILIGILGILALIFYLPSKIIQFGLVKLQSALKNLGDML